MQKNNSKGTQLDEYNRDTHLFFSDIGYLTSADL